MFPNLWIFDMYSVFMFIGILACFALLYLYMKKNNLKRNYILDSLILACISIALGILSITLINLIDIPFSFSEKIDNHLQSLI